jgi:hypothetical protein
MIRDMVYLDGGDISWYARMNDGKTSTAPGSGKPCHHMFTLQ